jgi:hypothetical protein
MRGNDEVHHLAFVNGTATSALLQAMSADPKVTRRGQWTLPANTSKNSLEISRFSGPADA